MHVSFPPFRYADGAAGNGSWNTISGIQNTVEQKAPGKKGYTVVFICQVVNWRIAIRFKLAH